MLSFMKLSRIGKAIITSMLALSMTFAYASPSILMAQTGTSTGINVTGNSDVTVLQLNSQIKDKKAAITDLHQQIQAYQSNIDAKQSQTTSLQNEMASIDDQIAKAGLDIQATQDEVDQIDLETKQVNIDMATKQQEISTEKDRLA